MLKMTCLMALIALSTLFARGDDHANTDGASVNDSANDGTSEPAPPRRDVYQKLGISSSDSAKTPGDATPDAIQPERAPAQEQIREDAGSTSPPRDTSEQPLNQSSPSQ